MEKPKKIIVLLLSLVLLMGSSTTVLAEGEDDPTATDMPVTENVENNESTTEDLQINLLEETAGPDSIYTTASGEQTVPWVNARLTVESDGGIPFNGKVAISLIKDGTRETYYLYAINGYEYHFQAEPGVYAIAATIVNDDNYQIVDVPAELNVETGLSAAVSLNIKAAPVSNTEDTSLAATSNDENNDIITTDQTNETSEEPAEESRYSMTNILKNMGLEALGLSIMLALFYYFGNKIFNRIKR